MKANMSAFLIATGSIIVAAVIIGSSKVFRKSIARKWRERKIYYWLKKNTEDKAGRQFKTTDEISQALGILGDDIRDSCTSSKRIYQRSDRKDSWGIYGDKATSVYEDRGLTTV